jgi:predicted PP-loop superfamily ATPase
MSVVKETNNSVQIRCQSCNQLYWVKRGSFCHRTDVCGKCSQLISGRVLKKMQEMSEQDD